MNPDDESEFFWTCANSYLYVLWIQGYPSLKEFTALHQVDPDLRDRDISEVSAMLQNAVYWRLGPFISTVACDEMELKLRSVQLLVQRKSE